MWISFWGAGHFEAMRASHGAAFIEEPHRIPVPKVKRQFEVFRMMINDSLGNFYSLPRQEAFLLPDGLSFSI
jgi:hypothetical protein